MTKQGFLQLCSSSSEELLFDRKSMYNVSHTETGIHYAFDQLSTTMQRRLKQDNMHLLPEMDLTSGFGLPSVEAYNGRLDYSYFVPFSRRRNYPVQDTAIHFFGYDEVIYGPSWIRIDETTAKIKDYPLIIGPDFSVFVDAPFPINLFNVYRSRTSTSHWQRWGLPAVPVFSFGDVNSLSYCLEGLPCDSVIALTGVGHESSRSAEKLWNYCVSYMIEVKRPTNLIIYGGTEYKYRSLGVPVRYIPDHINLKLRAI